MAKAKIYNVSELEIGESVLLPWRLNAQGSTRGVCQKAIYTAVYRETKKTGKRFAREGRPLGCLVTRLK